jgi:hypothetical protein
VRSVQISPEERAEFLSAFARQHFGWLARLCITYKDGGEKSTELLPLAAIENLQNGDIRIVLGDSQGLAQSVMSIRLLQTDDGADAGLELASNDRSIFLQFRVAAHPEMIDGILPSEAA